MASLVAVAEAVASLNDLKIQLWLNKDSVYINKRNVISLSAKMIYNDQTILLCLKNNEPNSPFYCRSSEVQALFKIKKKFAFE